MTSDRKSELMELVALMDQTEQTMLLYTLELVAAAKSKGWRTRRINDFCLWLQSRPAPAKAGQAA